MLRGAEDDFDVGEGVQNAMGSLVEYVRWVAAGQFFQRRFALSGLCGKEAVEGELFGGQSAADKSADGRVGAGDGKNVDVRSDGRVGYLSAWVGDSWGAGITYDRDARTLLQLCYELLGARAFV